MMELKNISYSYASAVGKTKVLYDISETIKPGITAVIGRSGSGKTTLAQIIAGITVPDTGSVTINGTPVHEASAKIGVLFQHPENQLFAETVYEDIMFGPKNLGITGVELDKCVHDAAKLTSLSDDILKKTPYELSGGQKRLAALAGVLAMKPEVLVLDEPAAGLDPKERKHIFSVLKALTASDSSMIIIFVTHSMDDAALYGDDIIVLDSGVIAAHNTAHEIFTDTVLLNRCGLDIPEMQKLSMELKKLGIDIGEPLTVDEAYTAIMNILTGGVSHAS